QVFLDYGFHPLVQRWIIGQCLCVDERTVGSYGIRGNGDTAFLYLLSAHTAELTEQQYEEDQARVMLSCTSSPTEDSAVARRYNTLPSTSPRKGVAPGMETPALGGPVPGLSISAVSLQAGWACPKCTFINKPTRPGCEMCSTDRPDDYVVPGGYKPDETELWRMQQEQEGIRQYQQ
ncbi:RanBP-type and C3HC4-type zinc finger-containing protein 1, partial [Chaetura pelagica]